MKMKMKSVRVKKSKNEMRKNPNVYLYEVITHGIIIADGVEECSHCGGEEPVWKLADEYNDNVMFKKELSKYNDNFERLIEPSDFYNVKNITHINVDIDKTIVRDGYVDIFWHVNSNKKLDKEEQKEIIHFIDYRCDIEMDEFDNDTEDIDYHFRTYLDDTVTAYPLVSTIRLVS